MLLYNALKKNEQGFTLIEVLVVIIIVGIIASISAPNFINMLRRNSLTTSSGEVASAVREAQRFAKRRGRACNITFTSIGTGIDQKPVIEVSPDAVVGGTNISYAGCLSSRRILENKVSLDVNVGGVVSDVNSASPATLNFSGKGTPDVQGIMIVSHADLNTEKCIQIQGILGNILTGDYYRSQATCQAE